MSVHVRNALNLNIWELLSKLLRTILPKRFWLETRDTFSLNEIFWYFLLCDPERRNQLIYPQSFPSSISKNTEEVEILEISFEFLSKIINKSFSFNSAIGFDAVENTFAFLINVQKFCYCQFEIQFEWNLAMCGHHLNQNQIFTPICECKTFSIT